MKVISEEVVCAGPCQRTFLLQTELQKTKGGDPWMCGICRFNEQLKNVQGFKPKGWEK